MALGVFGKVPQKGDFVTANLPLPILRPFEQWLDAALASSRVALGEGWQDAYLIAPIWHFQFGKAVFGFRCRGAIMSSVDAVGRFFPLTVIDWTSDTAEGTPAADWDARLEAELLAVLGSDAPDALDRLRRNLATIAPPIGEQDLGSTWWQLGQVDPVTFDVLPPPQFYTAMLEAKPYFAVPPANEVTR